MKEYRVRLPVQAQVQLTDWCNFECDHCFASSGSENSGHMPDSILSRTLSQLNEVGVRWVQMSGGEPVKADLFYQAVQRALTELPPKEVSILTNGSLWTEDDIERVASLEASGPGRLIIQVSFDGHDDETFATARNVEPGTFARICGTVKSMRSKGLYVAGLLVVTSRNEQHALDTARFAIQEVGMNSFAVVPLYVSGRAMKNYRELEFQFDSWARTLLKVSEIKSRSLWGADSDKLLANMYNLYEIVLPLDDTPYMTEVWGLGQESIAEINRPSLCEAGFTDVCIEHNGRVFPCPTASAIDDFCAGNIMEADLVEIWRDSRVLQWFRSAPGRVIKQMPCSECKWAHSCGGGCRVSSYVLLGDPELPDPRCPIVRRYRGE